MSGGIIDPGRKKARGQFLFALAFVVLGVALAVQLPFQTTWLEDTSVFVQPRFMPTVAIIGMVLFGCLHLWFLPRRRIVRSDWGEVRVWVSGLEFVAWYMVYVFIVPVAGYLATTVVFCWLLVLRMGYNSRRIHWFSVLFAAAVVIVFKTLLKVKIPGAAVYELLPPLLRNFLIVNL